MRMSTGTQPVNGIQNSIDMYVRAMAALSALTGKPTLYGPDNRPLSPTVSHGFERDASRRSGSLKNWVPKRLLSRQTEALRRLEIVERSVDLTNNDPHAAGLVDTFAATVIGPGLTPYPTLDSEALGLDEETTRKITRQQLSAYNEWSLYADAGGRMSFGQIQYLTKVCMLRYGEYFVLLPMIDRGPLRFSLACQVIHPLRVKTPVDKTNNPNIRDGIELGEYGETVAVWIKKSDPGGMGTLPDISSNFVRVPVKTGHRLNIIHRFVTNDPEQVRGTPRFAAAMKYFRDLSDLLNAELVSNVVTAALSYFIETQGGAPWQTADNLSTYTETFRTGGNSTQERTRRYQETHPGMIMYGNVGEKPHLLAANRPGTTFEPFVKTVKKSLAMSLNLPYPVAFKDVDGVSFAGFRSAMLEAWRVFSMERIWHADGFCQPVWTMLQEEAWLLDRVDIDDFYSRMWVATSAKWRGFPKGDIEPAKAATTNIALNKANLKTKAAIAAENGDGDIRDIYEQLASERHLEVKKGLSDDEKAETAGSVSNGEENNGNTR